MMSSLGLAEAAGADPGFAATALVVAILGVVFVRLEAVATVFVEGLAGAATGGDTGFPCKKPVPIRVAATKIVAANAPHLVLRFQNNAATITGAIAANP